MADAERGVDSRRSVPTRPGVDGWWAEASPGRVVRLEGAPFDVLRLALDPLPATAPAVLAYQPQSSRSVAALIASLLDELDQAAVGLFPLWLPGARDIAGSQGAGVAAVRALAFESAATSSHFGPFLADLAERALRHQGRPADGFAPVVIAAGLARVYAASYRRDSAALLVDVPAGLTAEAERAMVAAAEWIAHHGRWGVWLSGAPLLSVDRVESVVARVPPKLADLVRELVSVTHSPAEATPAGISLPPVSGMPRADSAAETRLESALSRLDWAIGRTWNETYPSHALATAIRLDLWWAAEKCVVEIDGPEHRGAVHYAADRQRDVLLQLDGHAVLRFTNAQVLGDTQNVVSQIERFIRSRRTRSQEKSHDVHR